MDQRKIQSVVSLFQNPKTLDLYLNILHQRNDMGIRYVFVDHLLEQDDSFLESVALYMRASLDKDTAGYLDDPYSFTCHQNAESKLYSYPSELTALYSSPPPQIEKYQRIMLENQKEADLFSTCCLHCPSKSFYVLNIFAGSIITLLFKTVMAKCGHIGMNIGLLSLVSLPSSL